MHHNNGTWGQCSNLVEVERAILESDDSHWKRLAFGNDEVAVFKYDLNLRIVGSVDEGDLDYSYFTDRLAGLSATPGATSYWYDVYYGASIVHRSTLVLVDCGRALLPVPRSAIDLTVNALDYRLAEIFEPISSSLTTYMQAAGMTFDSEDNGSMA